MIVKVNYFNESFCKLQVERELAIEIQETFSFLIPDHKFNPLVKAKRWDGRVRMYNMSTKTFPVGLIPTLKEWAQMADYIIQIDKKYTNTTESKDIIKGVRALKLKNITLRDYQEESILKAVTNKRSIIVSPTGSGKSAIIFGLIQYYMDAYQIDKDTKALIVVPTGTLVFQLYNDFKDYGLDVNKYVHMIVQGEEKKTDKPIIISTWQALQYMAKENKSPNLKKHYYPEYFKQFQVFIGDECHHFQSDALKAIGDCCIHANFRFGLTGSLSESKTHEMVLTGVFGPKFQLKTTKDLMTDGTLSKLDTKCINFVYPNQIKNYFRKNKPSYADEIEYLITLERRNKYIAKLGCSVKGNSLIIYKQIKQGEAINEFIKQMYPEKTVYFFTGEIPADERNEIRKKIEEGKDCIILGTLGAISTGINIVNLNNIIFASPSKSRIKVMQSIGRVLRKSLTKSSATLYDISDNISLGRYENYTWKHFKHRLNLYHAEQFDYTLHEIEWS